MTDLCKSRCHPASGRNRPGFHYPFFFITKSYYMDQVISTPTQMLAKPRFKDQYENFIGGK
jgi:hypothetical protein